MVLIWGNKTTINNKTSIMLLLFNFTEKAVVLGFSHHHHHHHHQRNSAINSENLDFLLLLKLDNILLET